MSAIYAFAIVSEDALVDEPNAETLANTMDTSFSRDLVDCIKAATEQYNQVHDVDLDLKIEHFEELNGGSTWQFYDETENSAIVLFRFQLRRKNSATVSVEN